VTGRGARSFWRSIKPQLIDLALPVRRLAQDGRRMSRKDAEACSKAAARLCEARKNRATASRFLFNENRLHMSGDT
jgi:hypothetical protein